MTLQKHKSKSSRLSRKPRPKRGSTRKGPQAKKPREVALAEVKDDLSKYLRLAVEEEIVITRHGRAAGVLIGFSSEEDWFEYRLTHHPEFCVASRKHEPLFARVREFPCGRRCPDRHLQAMFALGVIEKPRRILRSRDGGRAHHEAQ